MLFQENCVNCLLCSVKVNLNRPMNEVLAELSNYPVRSRLSLTGTLVVARDIAHAKLKERLDRGEGLPEYIKNHPVYYAGPAKTPKVNCWSMSGLMWSQMLERLSFCGCLIHQSGLLPIKPSSLASHKYLFIELFERKS